MFCNMMQKGVYPLLILLASQSAWAASMPVLIDWPAGRKVMEVAAEGVDGMQVVVVEIAFPEGGKPKIIDADTDFNIIVNSKSQGLTFMWEGKQLSYERYFEVTLTPQANIEQNAVLSTLVVIPPNSLLTNYEFKNSVFMNQGNGYVVLMENLQCGRGVGRSWIVGPGRQLKIHNLKGDSELLVGRGDKLDSLKSCLGGHK